MTVNTATTGGMDWLVATVEHQSLMMEAKLFQKGSHKARPLVVYLGVHVYMNDKGVMVIDQKDLNRRVKKWLEKKGLA